MGHWLLKAEPDSRIVKGKDVKFSVDDFEECKTSSWEGVRNHQAKNYLKQEMKLGEECLFYASNCKTPGVTALCKVVKEGYPDYNAWDPSHPYYDPKSDKEQPTWYMVDVEFVKRLKHMVPLKLLQAIGKSDKGDVAMTYLKDKHIDAIKDMPLLNRGRLSVQPVSDDAYEAVILLGNNGGWDDWLSSATPSTSSKKRSKAAESDDDVDGDKPTKKASTSKASTSKATGTSNGKRKAKKE